MKKIFFILSILISGIAYGQVTGHFRFDSTMLYKNGGNNELILLNGTRGVTGGVLTNMGNGRTRFVTPTGGTVTSLGSGFKIGVNNTNNVKSILPSNGLTGDSATAGQVGVKLGGTLTQATRINAADTYKMVYDALPDGTGDTAFALLTNGGMNITFTPTSGNRNFANPISNRYAFKVDSRNLTENIGGFFGDDFGVSSLDKYNFYDSLNHLGAVTGYQGASSAMFLGYKNANENLVLQFHTSPRRSVYADSGHSILFNGRNLDFASYGANNFNIRFGKWSNGISAANEFGRFNSVNGYFGLGTTLPTERLTVNGNIRINAISNVGTPDSALYIEDGIIKAGLAGGSGSVSISALTAAAASNSIDNVAHNQHWSWNSLTSGTGLSLSANTTGAASNTQQVLAVATSGANSNASQTTFGATFSNTHTGTGSTNIAAAFTAQSGTNNFAIRLIDGTEGNGKVLTSDASGNASWQAAGSGSNIYNTDGTLTGNRTLAGGTNNLTFSNIGTYSVGVNTDFSVATIANQFRLNNAGKISLQGVSGITMLSVLDLQSITDNVIDTSANKPLARNTSTGAVVEMNSWAQVSGGSSGITVGTTTITSGTSTRIPFNDAGVYGEDAGLTYNKTTDALAVVGPANIQTLRVGLGLGAIATNTAVGFQALNTNTSGSLNTAFGYRTLDQNTTGYYNTAIGHAASLLNQGGALNTAVGESALYSNLAGNSNVAVGVGALQDNLNNYNVAVGASSLRFNTNGYFNMSLGGNAMYNNLTGINNAAVGYEALYDNTTGSNNIAIGYNTGKGIQTGSGNTIIAPNITGLSSSLANNIILGSGGGIKAQHDGTDWVFTGGATITGSFATPYVAKTTTYPITGQDHTIEATSGTFTTTLPTAVGITGRQYVITNSGAGVLTLATTSSQTFVNVTATPTTLTLNQFNTVIVVSNGANWLRISSL